MVCVFWLRLVVGVVKWCCLRMWLSVRVLVSIILNRLLVICVVWVLLRVFVGCMVVIVLFGLLRLLMFMMW